MKILINDKAKKMILKKSKDRVITLDIYQPNHCWVQVQEPSVEIGTPKEAERHYEVIVIDDITVYCDRTIYTLNDQVETKVASYLGIKYLKVEKCSVQ